LLSFIPRYLGVMLVNYRRVRRPSHTHSQSHTQHAPTPERQLTARPAMRKAASSMGVSLYPTPDSPPPTNSGENGSDSDTELPEVALDRNKHIIPSWMLRSRPYSRFVPGNGRQLERGTASTPDLAAAAENQERGGKRSAVRRHVSAVVPDANNRSGTSSSPLARSTTSSSTRGRTTSHSYPIPVLTPLHEPKTPANSPEDYLKVPPAAPTDDTPANKTPRPELHRLFDSQPNLDGTSWFGGTGSTIVNTRLQEHVFGTILRKFRRRAFAGGIRTEDEGEQADVEASGGGEWRKRRKKRGDSVNLHRRDPAFRRLIQETEDGGTGGLRRVQSEGLIATATSRGKLRAMQTEEQLGERQLEDNLGLFGTGIFDLEEQSSKSPPIPNGIKRRSRSRSFDSPVPRSGHPVVDFPPISKSAPPVIRERNELPPSPPSPVTQPSPPGTLTRQEHFILLEDLTGRLRSPCVMDLKMGTRQYGIDATPGKKKSQRKKCDRTTSRTLGVRVCGMQVCLLLWILGAAALWRDP
jgi:inositol-hexakisphosphate kinase